jgi:hypothetical protein
MTVNIKSITTVQMDILVGAILTVMVMVKIAKENVKIVYNLQKIPLLEDKGIF